MVSHTRTTDILESSTLTHPITIELFKQVVDSLRDAVHALEENELFEPTLLRGSQIALEQQPGVADIDALMRSMMVAPLVPPPNVPVSSFISGAQPLSQNDFGIHGPINGHQPQCEGFSPDLASGKRSRNGT